MSDGTRRLILARRARCGRPAASTRRARPTNARADDGSTDAAIDAPADAETDADAGDADPQPCLCVIAPETADTRDAPLAPIVAAAAAVIAARRRRRQMP